MRSVLLIAALVGLASAGSLLFPKEEGSKLADKEFLTRQKVVFDLLNHIYYLDTESEYYKLGHEYDIKANFDKYTNKKAVEEFYQMFEHGMLPKDKIFSIFYEEQREEAIALFHLFYYAKDFETFYKSAAWARIYMNEGMFVYSFTVAVLHREDLRGIALPAPYEIYPWYFVNSDVISKMYRVKMQEGIVDVAQAHYYGIDFNDKEYIFYANYSGWYTHFNGEQKLSYFTEDIGLNSYYYYFHMDYPFWMNGEEFGLSKDRRGELFYYTHQQLLARYYMERLTNGMSEIPKFSWYTPIKTGYYPSMTYFNGYQFPVRSNFYKLDAEEDYEEMNYIVDFERTFRDAIDAGEFTIKGQKFDLEKASTFDILGCYFQLTPEIRAKFGNQKLAQNFEKYFDIMARVMLGASGEPVHEFYAGPSALEQYETSLRDPVFWQLYKRVIYYFIMAKQQLEPYTKSELHFPGVKVENVKVDKLITFFDFFNWDATNALFFKKETYPKHSYTVRQPRLENKPFSIEIDVNSEKEGDAVFKIFFGPKYDSYGRILSFSENQYNFMEMDSFVYRLTAGKNSVVRKSEDFWSFAEDRTPAYELYKKFESGTFELNDYESHDGFPQRLMLPKGTKGGFPFQFFVVVYPYVAPKTVFGSNYDENIWSGVGTGARYFDEKAFGYPLDRPIDEAYFFQPNMFIEEVAVYHEGDYFPFNFLNKHVSYNKPSKH